MVHWVKRPTYEEVVKDIEKDYKVKLPNRVALHFHDSFAMAQFREQQQAIVEGQRSADEARGEAMTQAAEESGIGRRELLEFAQQLGQQNSAAINELQSQHAASATSDRRAAEAQAESFARQLAEHQVRADNRERLLQRALEELRQHPQIPAALVPAVPNAEDIRQAVRQTADQIHGRVSQDIRALAGGMANATGEAIRGMQNQHGQSLSQMLNILQQGVPTQQIINAPTTHQHVHLHEASSSSSSAAAAPPPPPPPPPKKIKDRSRSPPRPQSQPPLAIEEQAGVILPIRGRSRSRSVATEPTRERSASAATEPYEPEERRTRRRHNPAVELMRNRLALQRERPTNFEARRRVVLPIRRR